MRKEGRREKPEKKSAGRWRKSIRICFTKLTKEARKLDKNTQVYRQIIQQEGRKQREQQEAEKRFLLTEAEESLVRRRNL